MGDSFGISPDIIWAIALAIISGLRGAIALALSLSKDFPHCQLIVAMMLGIAVVTIGRCVGWG